MIERVCSLLRIKPPKAKDEGLLLASGDTVPADGTDGYQKGCLFQHTDDDKSSDKSYSGDATGMAGVGVLWVNYGNSSSCDFRKVVLSSL